MKRLLVVKMADIGDLILTTPALSALRQQFPKAQIDILTTAHAAPILNGTGLIDHVLTFKVATSGGLRDLLRPAVLRESLQLAWQLRAGHYETVLTFHQLTTRLGALKQAMILLATGAPQRCGLDNGKGWFFTHRVTDLGFGVRHQAEYWLEVVKLLGAAPGNRQLHIGLSEADQTWARERLPDGPYYAAIHPGSGGFNTARRWEPEKFAAVADALHTNQGATIVLIGGPSDDAQAVLQHMQHTPINLAGQTTLGQLTAVLARCKLYVGSDSGVSHIAAATPGLIMYSLFGPTNHRAWGPWRPESDPIHIIRSGALCSPCGYVDHGLGLPHGCEARTCMKMIQPDSIPSAAEKSQVPPGDKRQNAPALHVLGIPLDALTFSGLLDRIAGWIGGTEAKMICTANPELVMIAQRDVNFFNILRRADVVTADGVGLLWAARHLGHPLPERVTGSDSLPLIAGRAAREGWRLFLLGAAPGTADKAATALAARYPGLKIAGTFAGSPSAAEEDDLVARVNASGADILFLAYGSPAQEKWIARNLPRLRVSVIMGVGGAFDFAAGITQRAPEWMRRAGIEWLHRLIKQPWRWRRMLRLPRFVLTVLRRGARGPVNFVGRNIS